MLEFKKKGEMIMKIIAEKGIWLLLLAIYVCSCQKEEQPEKVKQLYIQLTMPESIHVDTKADDTGKSTVPKLGGIEVKNVWIVQFDAKTNSCLKALYVPQSGISQNESLAGLVVNLSTGSSGDEIAKFMDNDSRFYVIANGDRNLLTEDTTNDDMYSLTEAELQALTEEDFKKKARLIGQEGAPLVATSPTLLASEAFEYIPSNDGVIKVRAQMFRAFAWMTVKIKSSSPSGLFSLDKNEASQTIFKIHNLPQNMAVYRAGGGKGIAYPEVKDTSIIKGPFNVNIDPITTTGGEVTATFYMAENLRGIGTSTTQQGKNLPANGPGSSSDKLAGCTYIELTGTYKYNSSHTDGVKVKYTFYLGGNFTNDYNIARDYSYELTFNIAGPNSADVRVQITDGNVAVFDEVHVVDNIEVNF